MWHTAYGELRDWLTCRRSLSKARQASQRERVGCRSVWAAASPSCRTPLWLSSASQLSRNNWTYEQTCSGVTRPERGIEKEINISIVFEWSGFNRYSKQHTIKLLFIFNFIFFVKQTKLLFNHWNVENTNISEGIRTPKHKHKDVCFDWWVNKISHPVERVLVAVKKFHLCFGYYSRT